MGGMHTSKSKTRKYFGSAAVYFHIHSVGSISAFSLFPRLFFLMPVLLYFYFVVHDFCLNLNFLSLLIGCLLAPVFRGSTSQPCTSSCVRKAAGGLFLNTEHIKKKKRFLGRKTVKKLRRICSLVCDTLLLAPTLQRATATVTNAPFLATLRRSSRFLSFAWFRFAWWTSDLCSSLWGLCGFWPACFHLIRK